MKPRTIQALRRLTTPALLAAAVAAAPALAAPPQDHGQEHDSAHPLDDKDVPGYSAVVHFVDRSDWVLGLPVVDPRGERLGEVSDLMLEPDGRIAYAAFDGDTLTRDRLLAVGWSCFRVDYDDRRAVLATPLEQIKQVEGFEPRSTWPRDAALDCGPQASARSETGDAGEGGGETEAVEGRPTEASAAQTLQRPVRLEWLKGQRVATPTGDRLGVIREIAVDLGAGRATYFAMQEALRDPEDRLIAVPWGALKLIPDPDADQGLRPVLTVSQEQIEGAPTFLPDEEHWGQMSEPEWVERVYEHYGLLPYFAGRIQRGVQPSDPGRGTRGVTPPTGGVRRD